MSLYPAASISSTTIPEKYLIETMAGGVAVFDYDDDGWPDVFFVNGARIRIGQQDGELLDKSAPEFWNRLYRNNHDGTFTDMTEKAGVRGTGYGMGAAVGDFDNDGFEDLLVTNYGGVILYHNNGNGTFTDVSERAGLRTQGWMSSAGFFDYDNDAGWTFLSADIWIGASRRASIAAHAWKEDALTATPTTLNPFPIICFTIMAMGRSPTLARRAISRQVLVKGSVWHLRISIMMAGPISPSQTIHFNSFFSSTTGTERLPRTECRRVWGIPTKERSSREWGRTPPT
jgi:hypothetical protein